MSSPEPPDFVALIPARRGSTRLPDKPLADLGGRPMVVRVAERARASGARLVAIATDSRVIADAANLHGFQTILTRADHPSGTDRLAEAAAALGLDDEQIVVNVQGDEPLIPPALIAAVAQALVQSPECAMATAAHPIHSEADFQNPNIVKVVADAAGRALYFSRAAIPFERDRPTPLPDAGRDEGSASSSERVSRGLSASDLPLRHVGLYAYRAAFLARFPSLTPAPIERIESLEQLRVLWHGHRIALHLADLAPPAGVDTPADLERVRAWFAAQSV